VPSYGWTAPDGSKWDSQYEYHVFTAIKALGLNVRRCEKGGRDTFNYQEAARGLRCLDCGSSQCVQERTYTADFYIAPDGEELDGPPTGEGYYIEAKGYFRQNKRGLFRHFRRSHPTADVRMVAQKNIRIGKGNLASWCKSYGKIPVHFWDHKKDDVIDVIPEEWM